ncbi:MAG TPA: glycerate kinase [Candidatus Paceibacterota bacterium]|nr:glycerate kinase [Verrucomicrobiota bacterium]HSA09233.1 glycerate kinase [Candidatus Paceibacterota bacterium]
MPLRVLIIPDKFKGTLTAQAAAVAIARGWRSARPRDSLDLLPMTDGGDGFGELTRALLKARTRRVKTVDAAHRPRATRWWWEPRTRTAIIESAGVIGLAALPHGRFHPFQLDTQGLGAVVSAALRSGADRCLLGLGGSATNDGGFGLARALGWKFLDRNGQPIMRWTNLDRLERIGVPQRRRRFEQLLVATDVQNPLLGPRGATRVFGPQKGLRARDFGLAERCLGRLARVVRRQFGCDAARVPGAGAAGGLGFGLMAFLGARLQPGFDLFARHAALERHLRAADLVVTGEGAIDRSTLMGKGVGRIARRCRELNLPCIGLAGLVHPSRGIEQHFVRTHAVTSLTTVQQANACPARWLEQLARQVARSLDKRAPEKP